MTPHACKVFPRPISSQRMHPPILTDPFTTQDISDGCQNLKFIFGPSPSIHGFSLSRISSCGHASTNVGALFAYSLKDSFCWVIRFYSNGVTSTKAAAIVVLMSLLVFPATLSTSPAGCRLLAACRSRSLTSCSDLIVALISECLMLWTMFLEMERWLSTQVLIMVVATKSFPAQQQIHFYNHQLSTIHATANSPTNSSIIVRVFTMYLRTDKIHQNE